MHAEIEFKWNRLNIGWGGGALQRRDAAENVLEWQAGIRGEVLPLRNKPILRAVLTFEHNQLGKTGQQDQLQPPPTSPHPLPPGPVVLVVAR